MFKVFSVPRDAAFTELIAFYPALVLVVIEKLLDGAGLLSELVLRPLVLLWCIIDARDHLNEHVTSFSDPVH